MLAVVERRAVEMIPEPHYCGIETKLKHCMDMMIKSKYDHVHELFLHKNNMHAI